MTSITIQLLVRTTMINTLVPIVYIPTVIHRIVMIIIVEQCMIRIMRIIIRIIITLSTIIRLSGTCSQLVISLMPFTHTRTVKLLITII